MTRAAIAFILAVVVAPVIAFVVLTTMALGDLSFRAIELHITFIGIAVALALALGILALRTHVAGGDARSLSIGAALLAFAAIYVWHGVFTRASVPFTFLIYGPVSRVAFGAALLGLASARRFTEAERVRNVAVVACGAVILAGSAYAASHSIDAFARGATASQVNVTRFVVEWIALAFALTAVTRLALRGERGKLRMILLAGVSFTIMQSIFFLPALPWSTTWWSAHVLGAAGTFVLAWGTVVVLQDEQQERAIARLTGLERERAWFINMAAHELRTPLTPIKIQLHLLASQVTGADPARDRAVALIGRNVARLSSLIDDILLAARHQSADADRARAEITNVSEVLTRVASVASDGAREEGITVDARIDAGLHAAITPDEVGHVLAVLVTSGITATPKGGLVEVTARRENGSVVVRVTDGGDALSPVELARVFQPFSERGDDPRGGRAGLELYIVQRIIADNGGRVWCENATRRSGTSFCFALPFVATATTD